MRTKNEQQMIDYGVRMRKERDAAFVAVRKLEARIAELQAEVQDCHDARQEAARENLFRE